MPHRDRPIDVRPLNDLRADLAESPRWDGRRWLWVDVPDGSVWAQEGATPELLTAFGMRASLVVPMCDGVRFLVALGQSIAVVEEDRHVPWAAWDLGPHSVLNDGIADPDGGLWIGSVDLSGGDGALWRIDARGDAHLAVGGFVMSNGMAWSADRRALFHADSGTGIIWRHVIGPGRMDIVHSERWLELGHELTPDGLASDSADGLWVALHGSGEAHRYDHDRHCTHRIAVGAAEVTALEFGGADMQDLLLTTGREGEQARADARAGRLYVARAPYPGNSRPLGRMNP